MLHTANQCLPTSTSWTYSGEGGKHAIFSYQPNHTTTEINEEWIGRLLRIDKSAFRQCVGRSAYVNNNSSQSLLLPTTTISNDLDPFRNMMFTILQPYVDLPQTVLLDSAYICSLRDIALASGRIPSRRRSDWLTTDETDPEMNYDCSSLHSALVLLDYRLTASGYQQPAKEFSICFEIKPKCGYIPSSPLIDETRTYKYLKSRYVLLQNVYRTGDVTKDWMHNKSNDSFSTFESSKYDPIDLFSCDVARIRNSLRCLVECPQNNLRIWNDEKLLVGLGPTNDAASFNWGGFLELMKIKPFSGKSKVDVIDFLIEVTVQVLLEEPFLSRVLSLQKLDILDTDGAVRVYNRLIHLCNSNQNDAETLVDFHFEWAAKKYDDTCNTSFLMTRCPIAQPKDHSKIEKLSEQVDAMANLLKGTNGTLPSTEQLRTIRTQANCTIDSLSMEECCYLLQAWLLALTMCDLSFFIHYSKEAIDHDTQEQVDFGPDSNSMKVIATQTLDKPGRIAIRSTNNVELVLLYTLKAIDVDKKPASKLRSRHLKERQFDALIK
jgi:hypothetical protein